VRHQRFVLRRIALLLMIVTASVAAPLRAEGLVDNVNGISVGKDGDIVRFIGFTVTADGRVGRLLARGDKRPERPSWRLDGRGRTLLPGFVDAHGHLMGLGIAALTLDLSQTPSLAAAQAAIADYARRHGERRWLIGGGWNQEAWALGRFPTAAEIDAVVADKPVVLTRVDGHALWANRAAMQVAGITAKTADPPGGRIERLADGTPSGVFVDAAMALIERVVPQPLPREREAALMRAQELLLAQGVTALTDMGTTADDWNALRRLGDRGALVVRVMSYANSIDTAVSITGGGPTPWLYDDRLRMVGVKFYADGALGSRGACLKADYADAPKQRGLCLMDDARLRNLLSRAAFNDLQPAIHAIGDAANAQVLGAIEELAQTYKGDRRWRIEHAQVVDPADLPRFAQSGVIASMQPVHQTSDRTMAEARLGAARLAGAYAWASMLAKRARLAFGTDVPVESANPFAGLAAAITREDAKGEPFGGWQPQERIGREAALAAYTTGSAYAAFADDRLGRIAPGARADFILVDTDPLMSTPAQMRATKVLETFIGGQRVWRAGAAK
jgi:predicted amidohydrolase YtcJ